MGPTSKGGDAKGWGMEELAEGRGEGGVGMGRSVEREEEEGRKGKGWGIGGKGGERGKTCPYKTSC